MPPRLRVPKLRLSWGQMAWALEMGNTPDRRTMDELNYLRQLGIPFPVGQASSGRGNRLRYGFDELVECGVGLYALRQGFRPKDVKNVLVDNRKRMRSIYRKAYRAMPEAALTDPWVKSRGRSIPLLEPEQWLRLHDRYSDKSGTFELRGMDSVGEQGQTPFDIVERYPEQTAREVVPLTRLMLQWVAWALEAPETKTGPQT